MLSCILMPFCCHLVYDFVGGVGGGIQNPHWVSELVICGDVRTLVLCGDGRKERTRTNSVVLFILILCLACRWNNTEIVMLFSCTGVIL